MDNAFPVPGTQAVLTFERDGEGRLTRISCGAQTYLHLPTTEEAIYGDGFAVAQSIALPNALMRRVTAGAETWTEIYRWNDAKWMTEVDGVSFSYDSEGRVTSCKGPSGHWFYGYSGDHLSVIDTPAGYRQIVRDLEGRPIAVREAGYVQGEREYKVHYDIDGRRVRNCGRPANWNLDEMGRLWTVSAADGRVLHTYLWADFHCFARIDGPPGDPLAAVFTLDLTGTPVRVIDRHRGMRQLPRDAFGESLLQEPNVPGLFSGAIDGAAVRLPYRVLDPRTGAFDSRDPFTGLNNDPRRQKGYEGPLPAEFPRGGPYTVARNNPVSLADPTGAISDLWWFIPSALTWSYQNTLGSIFGFWLTLDFTPAMILWFLPNLFTLFQVDKLREWKMGGFFDAEFLGAKNYDGFALRSSGFLDVVQSATWTYQFLVNEDSEEFSKLEDARLFQPTADYAPTLYGTVLRVAPSQGDPFLLQGQRTPPNGAKLTTWSRNGGVAQPAFPDSLEEPIFPGGGLHFSEVQEKRKCPQAATIAELEPQAALLGSITNRAQGTWSGDAKGVANGQSVALLGTVVEITTVKSVNTSSGKTTAQFDTPAAALMGETVRLRGLAAPVGPEEMIAFDATHLSTSGTTQNYALNDILRLSLGGAVELNATVDHFEAQLNLDAALPATLATGTVVYAASATGNFTGTVQSGTELKIDTGTVPGAQSGIVVGGIAVVVQSVAADVVTVDRDLSGLGAAGTGVAWRNLTPGARLGETNAVRADAVAAYTETALRSAPSAGFVWCDKDGTFAARSVTGLAFDGLVISDAVSSVSSKYSVELLKPQAPDVSDVVIAASLQLDLTVTPAASVRAFHILAFAGAGIGTKGAAIVTAATVAAEVLTASAPKVSLPDIAPSDVVVLGAGGTLEAAVVRGVRVKVHFTSDVAGRDENLEAALVKAGPAYKADRLDDFKVRVQPIHLVPLAGGGTREDRVDFQRYRAGELVRVSWGLAAADERFFRIDTVDGTVITLLDDAAIPAAVVPQVQRLTISDPKTGTTRLGLNGKRASVNEIEFDVWNAGHFEEDDIVAILGDKAVARRVNFGGVDRAMTFTLAGAPTLAGPVDLSPPDLSGTSPSAFSTKFSISNNQVTFTELPLLAPASGMVLAVPYTERGSTAAGKLAAGTVRVPDDHENAAIENDRRQALTDHELTHTQQSARLGPWLFTWFPVWVTELLGDLPGSIGAPEFSRTVTAQYTEDHLDIADLGGVGFDNGSVVQISQDGRASTITLGARNGGRFSLGRDQINSLSSSNIREGAIGIRKEESGGWTEFYEVTQGVLQFITIGGLMNVLCTASYGGMIWLIIRMIQGIRGLAETTYAATVTSNTVITVKAGVSTAGLSTGTRISIQKGADTYIRAITSIAGQALTIGQEIPLTGDVQLAVFSARSPLHGDLNSYFKGTAPDRNRPAVLRIPELTLEVDDRVVVQTANNHSFNTVVTAVNPDGTVEVEEPVLVGDNSPELLVAKIGRDDPVGFYDQALLNKMHLGFLQYLHDPWGQIHYQTRPENAGLQVLTRSARYLFGTESWGLPALTGYFWWDNAYRRGEAELSAMEEEASHRSGDTYCPLASVHGDVAFVGDVARYWLTETGFLRDGTADMIDLKHQDAPGVRWKQYHDLSVSTNGEIGHSVPDLFALKGNDGIAWEGVSAKGWIPNNALLERTSGSYVAFTRPPVAGSTHTLDAKTLPGLSASRNAQTKGPSGVISSFVVPVPPTTRKVQISYAKDVKDVTVEVGGQPAAENDTLKLIPFETAAIDVSPNGARQYRAAVSQPGLVASVGADSLSIVAGSAVTRDFVEVSRFYLADGNNVTGIGPMHLAKDVDIAVRRFEVEVVTTLDLRATADVLAGAAAEVHAGESAFLLVPSPRFATPAPAITGALPVSPAVTVEGTLANDATKKYLGATGAAFRIAFGEKEPPEEDVTVSFSWKVGNSAADAVPVTASIALKPHFTLSSATGFSAAPGAVLVLEASDNVAIAVEGSIAGVAVTAGANPSQLTFTVDAAAALGTRDVLVSDTANAGRFARRRITIA